MDNRSLIPICVLFSVICTQVHADNNESSPSKHEELLDYLNTQIKSVSINFEMYGSEIPKEHPWTIATQIDRDQKLWSGTRLAAYDAPSGQSEIAEQAWGLSSKNSWNASQLPGQVRQVNIGASSDRSLEGANRASLGHDALDASFFPYHYLILSKNPKASVTYESGEVTGEDSKRKIICRINNVGPQAAIAEYTLITSNDGAAAIEETIVRMGEVIILHVKSSDFKVHEGVLVPHSIDYQLYSPDANGGSKVSRHRAIKINTIEVNPVLPLSAFDPVLKEGDFVKDFISGTEYFFEANRPRTLNDAESAPIADFGGNEIGEALSKDQAGIESKEAATSVKAPSHADTTLKTIIGSENDKSTFNSRALYIYVGIGVIVLIAGIWAISKMQGRVPR